MKKNSQLRNPTARTYCLERSGLFTGRIPKMFKRIGKLMLNLIICVLIPAAVVLLLSRLATGVYAAPRTYAEADVPARRVAIVLGAGLLRDGGPTAILRDRVQRAANLYFAGKIEKLLMSGDNRFENYNEPEAMRQYALQLGVPDGAIVLD